MMRNAELAEPFERRSSRRRTNYELLHPRTQALGTGTVALAFVQVERFPHGRLLLGERARVLVYVRQRDERLR